MKKIIVFLFLFLAVFIVMGASLQPPLMAEEITTTTAQEEITTTTTEAEETTTTFTIPEWILTDPAFLALMDSEALNQAATYLGINAALLAAGLVLLLFVVKWLKRSYEAKRAGNLNSVETQRLLEQNQKDQQLIMESLAMLGVQTDRVLPSVVSIFQAILAIAKTSKNDDLRALVPMIEENAILAQNALTASANALPSLLNRSGDGLGKILNINTDNILTVGQFIAKAVEEVKQSITQKAV